jgi:DNA modification methylase
VSAAFLDPPYNDRINGFAVGRRRHAEFAMASGEMTPEQYRNFLRQTLGPCAEVSKPGSVHFVCIDHRHIEDLIAACEGIYHERLTICVWNKSNGGMGSLYRSKHEFVLVMKVGDAPHTNNVELGRHGRNKTNVWDYAGVNAIGGTRRDDLELHPTTKPVQLVADALCDVTNRNATVLDAFAGSGTTLIACERTGRRFVGLDLDPRYVDTAIERWEALTGRKALHEASGGAFSEIRRDRLEGVLDHG